MNPYQTLGLKDNASKEEAKKAFREYAMHFHPDKHNNSEFFKQRFQEVQRAMDMIEAGHTASNAFDRAEILRLKHTVKLLESVIELCKHSNDAIDDNIRIVRNTIKSLKY